MISSDFKTYNDSWLSQLEGKYPSFVVLSWQKDYSTHEFEGDIHISNLVKSIRGYIILRSGTKITYK